MEVRPAFFFAERMQTDSQVLYGTFRDGLVEVEVLMIDGLRKAETYEFGFLH
jgi:hypothetical protein